VWIFEREVEVSTNGRNSVLFAVDALRFFKYPWPPGVENSRGYGAPLFFIYRSTPSPARTWVRFVFHWLLPIWAGLLLKLQAARFSCVILDFYFIFIYIYFKKKS
jgi:hypothetical protein